MTKTLFLTLSLILFALLLHGQTRIYVKHDATGENDGSSWADAFTDLETAIGVATETIWVAAGTYTPTTERGGNGDRFLAFQMKNGVAIYGGFSGTEDPNDFDLDDRDFDANETILSGDLGDGVQVYHVFRHVDLGLNDTAVLDGFTISGGKADGSDLDNKGGGMLNSGSSQSDGSSPTIRNCIFKDNEAAKGGAMYNSRYSSPVVSFTRFTNNIASSKGGAVFNTRNNPEFTNCVFISNQVTGSDESDGGGALYNNTQNENEGPIIDHCSFLDNMVPTTGTNTYGGGAIYSSINPGILHISNSQFTGNTGRYGGAIFHSSGNNANRDASVVKISNSIFELNTAEYGGAIFSDRHNIIVISCIIRGNEATEQSGGYYGREGSSQIINSLLSGNKSGKHGGGLYFDNETPEIINTTISGNYSGESGGGISVIGGSTVEIKNTIVWGNASPEGNELWVCDDCTVNIHHSLYGDESDDVYTANGGTVSTTSSLTDNPKFFNPVTATDSDTPNTSGIYMIQSHSPAVDAGNNDHLDGFDVTKDLRGGPRIVDGNDDNTPTVDIGAYEYNPTCSSNPPISGIGTVADPYIIAEPGNFCWMAQNPADWNKHYKQVVNIDLIGSENLDGGKGLRPIGNSTTQFTGTYNGQGYSISNLVINRSNESNVGLFGVIDGQSTQRVVLQNITLVNVNITGHREVGALVGLADQWNDITNCHVSGTVKGNRNTGGLVGWGRRTDFLRCSSSADVLLAPASGALYHGGLVGHINSTSTVKESFATGNVSGRGRVGGLIGAIGWNSQVENSYARGNVDSDISNPMIGGLIGEVWNAGVRKSYSTGLIIDVNGITSEFGGLVGNKTTDNNFYDENNFWDKETSGVETSQMGTGKSTIEMQTESTFTDASWDFNTIWAMNASLNDGYPYFLFNMITWTGNEDTNWGNADNWNPAQIPVTGNSVLINASSNNPVVDGARSVGDLTISVDASLTIPPEKSLTVNGTLVNNAGNAGLLIQSDASGTGSLINNTDDVPGTVQNYIVGGGNWNNKSTAWYYIAAPVVDQDIADAMAAAFRGGQEANHFDLYRWSEAQDTWINYHSNAEPLFDRTVFKSGEGYIFGAPASVTLSLSGKLGSGDAVWENLTYSGQGSNLDPQHPDYYTAGWHLLGNPFPSGIVATDTWTFTNIVHTPKLWNGSTYDDVSDGFIPANTAFFVQVVSSTYNNNNSLTIPFSARAHAAREPDKNSPQNRILLVAQAQGSEMRQQHVIRLEPDAAEGFDPRYDSRFMAGYAPQLFSITDTDRLSTIAIPEITDDLVIPMVFRKNHEGENFLIKLERNIPNTELYLHDLKTDTWHDLDFDKPYTFTADASDAPVRFELHFSPPSNDDDDDGDPTDIAETTDGDKTRMWYHNNQLYIQTTETGTHLTIYNLNGHALQTYKPEPGLQAYHIKLPPGVYIARLNGNSTHKILKIIMH